MTTREMKVSCTLIGRVRRGTLCAAEPILGPFLCCVGRHDPAPFPTPALPPQNRGGLSHYPPQSGGVMSFLKEEGGLSPALFSTLPHPPTIFRFLSYKPHQLRNEPWKHWAQQEG